VRTQLKICTEADYLQAHLTVIVAESRDRNLALDNLKQKVTSIMMKWITVVSPVTSSDLEVCRFPISAKLVLTGAGQHSGGKNRRGDRHCCIE
jgi:hypothetical protein